MANITFAGEVSIDECSIKTLTSKRIIDIRNQILAINIYEDLFSPFISGSLSIKDSVDLANALPFSGEEILKLKISTPTLTDSNIDQEFYIYKMSDREYINDKSIVYSLGFISKEAIVDMNKKISKSFSGSIFKIIQDLVMTKTGLESTKRLLIDKTTDSIKYISNFWSPVQNINFLCRRTNNSNNSPTFLFYENRSGFNFMSLDTLYSYPAKFEFKYNNSARSSKTKNIEIDFQRISEMSVPKVFDYIEDVTSGKFAAKKIAYDLTTKRYKVSTYDFTKDYSKFRHLNGFAPMSGGIIKRYNANMSTDIQHYDVHNGYNNSTTDNINAMTRQSLLMQSKSNMVNITVPGRTDYTVGIKVFLKVYKVEPIRASETEDETIDKLLSGYYIIGAINHSIINNQHECVIELIKDSIMFDLTKGN